jgi:hypothetical protein
METKHFLPKQPKKMRETTRSPMTLDTPLTSCPTPASSTCTASPTIQRRRPIDREHTISGLSPRPSEMGGSRQGFQPYPLRSPQAHSQNLVPPSSPLPKALREAILEAAGVDPQAMVNSHTGVHGGGRWPSGGGPLSPHRQRQTLDTAPPHHGSAFPNHPIQLQGLTTLDESTQLTIQAALPLPPTSPSAPTTAGSYNALPGQTATSPNLPPASPTQRFFNQYVQWPPSAGN